MKVLIISGSFPPMKCGVGDYSKNLAIALAAMPKVHVGVLTSIGAEKESKLDVIEVFPIMRKWSIFETFKAIKVIWKWSPNIVHIQYPTQGYQKGLLPWFLPLICCLLGVTVVQTWHEAYAGRDLPKLFFKFITPGTIIVVRPNYIKNLHGALRLILSRKNFVFIRNASSIPKKDVGEDEYFKLRRYYLNSQKRLIVFFGFVYPNKGVELLFDIADPTTDQIIIAGEIDMRCDFAKNILKLASSESWKGKALITGFLAKKDVSVLLAAADAVILPYSVGGGEWNTSIHAAVLQGTFVLTTSGSRFGYDEKTNVYYAKIDDIQEMKSILDKYAGRKRRFDADIDRNEWEVIAAQHQSVYQECLTN